MRVLGVVCGPHRMGNTALLVRRVLEGAEEKGYETELICLSDLQISPLSEGPGGLYEVSFPKDDMEKVYRALERMDVLVLGTPIYYDHVSARTKIFIDRLYYYNHPDAKKRFPRNGRAVLVITYEWDNPEAYDGVLEWLKRTLEHYWKLRVVATLKAEGTTKRPVAEREDLLERAKEIGLNL
ncbi:MAG: NADPH-dependent FMN reductase [Candidatus Bathyarchaeota archaeon B26-2]|nr:MAG: NADPH-dependent FMN reductase [Candidatus Bathyarchaeota archaeon B26-2]